MNGPSNFESAYGVRKTRSSTGSAAVQTVAATAPAIPPRTFLVTAPVCPCRANLCLGSVPLRELLADDLTHLRAVGPAGDLRHHVGHHTAEIGHASRPHLGDDVVDDLVDLVLGQRLRHELLEHVELALLRGGLLLAPAGPECLGGLDPALPLALQHLELLSLAQRPLQLLLRALERMEDQAQRVAALRVARAHRILQLVVDLLDQAHFHPPMMCQCRWNTVWPALGPTLTATR